MREQVQGLKGPMRGIFEEKSQRLLLYKNSGPGVKVFSEREGCCARAGVCVILNGETLPSCNVTMEADQFIVAQGYHDALFI